jgi:hypothetical protein
MGGTPMLLTSREKRHAARVSDLDVKNLSLERFFTLEADDLVSSRSSH